MKFFTIFGNYRLRFVSYSNDKILIRSMSLSKQGLDSKNEKISYRPINSSTITVTLNTVKQVLFTPTAHASSALSLIPLRIKNNQTLSITTLDANTEWHCAECCYAEFHNYDIMLKYVIQSVIMPRVVILTVIFLIVVAPFCSKKLNKI